MLLTAGRKQPSTGGWLLLCSTKSPNRFVCLTANASDLTVINYTRQNQIYFLFLIIYFLVSLERRICCNNSEMCLHSQANNRGRSHYQGSRPGATALQSLQCEGRQFQDASNVRQMYKYKYARYACSSTMSVCYTNRLL